MRRAKSVLAGCVLLLGVGCINVFDLESEVQLPIAELIVPESVTAQGPLNVSLTVVTGGCREFDRIESRRTGGAFILEAWGTDSGGEACTDDIRYEPHQYSINGPFSNPLIVSAVQPDGSSFTKTVRVE